MSFLQDTLTFPSFSEKNEKNHHPLEKNDIIL